MGRGCTVGIKGGDASGLHANARAALPALPAPPAAERAGPALQASRARPPPASPLHTAPAARARAARLVSGRARAPRDALPQVCRARARRVGQRLHQARVHLRARRGGGEGAARSAAHRHPRRLPGPRARYVASAPLGQERSAETQRAGALAPAQTTPTTGARAAARRRRAAARPTPRPPTGRTRSAAPIAVGPGNTLHAACCCSHRGPRSGHFQLLPSSSERHGRERPMPWAVGSSSCPILEGGVQIAGCRRVRSTIALYGCVCCITAIALPLLLVQGRFASDHRRRVGRAAAAAGPLAAIQ
jgi:hypothetical protein